jgi:hypothetical protein
VATLTEGDTQVTHTHSVTVQLRTTTGGLTIGYWFASPGGNVATVGGFTAAPTLSTQYPNVLAR